MYLTGQGLWAVFAADANNLEGGVEWEQAGCFLTQISECWARGLVKSSNHQLTHHTLSRTLVSTYQEWNSTQFSIHVNPHIINVTVL